MENPSKSEVIGCCGGDEKNEWPRRTDKSRKEKKKRTPGIIDETKGLLFRLFSLKKWKSYLSL